MRFKQTVIVLTATALMGACASRPSQKTQIQYNGPIPQFYIVKSGDTISKIARRYGLDYRHLARINGLNSNYTIYPNQRLRLERSANQGYQYHSTQRPKRQKTPVFSSQPNVPIDTTKINNPTPRPPKPNIPVVYPTPNMDTQSIWKKPTKGRIFQRFDLKNNIKGVRYSGNLGQPIYATQSGDVIYANNGLVEYGNLILVRHADGFISAYAHNQSLLVKEGDKVKTGHKIATMGSSGTDRVMLEFQIRKNGKAIDPMIILPK